MAWRTTSLMTIQGTSNVTPQPAWGSWITAVVSGTLAVPSSSPVTVTLGNATANGLNSDASGLFQPNTQAWLIDPNGANFETVYIGGVSGNNLTLNPKPNRPVNAPAPNFVIENPHVAGVIGTGTYILPKVNMNNILVIYEDGGTGPWLYLGNSPLMTTAKYRIYKIASVSAGTQPGYYSAAMFSANPFDVSELFVLGPNSDRYTVSLNVE